MRDESRTQSYDLHATRTDEVLHVEVKGTTTGGRTVVLTPNEVALLRDRHPHTMLFVVHKIDLDQTADPPIASGGLKKMIRPFWPADTALVPLGYAYTIPEAT